MDSKELELFREVLARVIGGPADDGHARNLVGVRITSTGATVVGRFSDNRFAGLPVEVVCEEMRFDAPRGETDREWSELLYDLLAHSDPMSGLGASLYYSTVRREGDWAIVEVTDGASILERRVSLTEVADGLPDDLAMSFLDQRL